eukprot:TRINITY_DN12280_c0_g1_i1.p1 TRINITY_DN12280_c0_g1~~TRINITY_DN12280_c0_g1_i1.p1  ORF type:complete len:358 (+),score=62.96 TRINITY_DN12280_c0_g1_i1:82-1155(+)
MLLEWRQFLICVGSIAAVVCVLLVVLFLYAWGKSYRFKYRTGVQEDVVPHTSPVELYYSSAAADSQHVLCCLLEKGVEFVSHDLDQGSFGTYETLRPEFRRVLPNGSVPALVHNGRVVLDTESIAQYIDQTFPGTPLFPKDCDVKSAVLWLHVASARPGSKEMNGQLSLGQAVAILLAPALCTVQCYSLRACIPAVLRHPNPLPEFPKILQCFRNFLGSSKIRMPKERAQLSLTACYDHLHALDSLLSDGREYIAGPYSMTDIMVAGSLNRLELMGVLDAVLKDEWRHAREYWSRVKRRRSFAPTYRPSASAADPKKGAGVRRVNQWLTDFKKVAQERGLIAALGVDEDAEEEEEPS